MLHSEVLVSPLQKEFEMEHRHWSTFIHAPFKQQLGIWQHCCCGFTDVHPNVKKVKRLKKKGEKSQFACDWLRTIDFCHFAEFSKGHPSWWSALRIWQLLGSRGAQSVPKALLHGCSSLPGTAGGLSCLHHLPFSCWEEEDGSQRWKSLGEGLQPGSRKWEEGGDEDSRVQDNCCWPVMILLGPHGQKSVVEAVLHD